MQVFIVIPKTLEFHNIVGVYERPEDAERVCARLNPDPLKDVAKLTYFCYNVERDGEGK